MKKVKGRPHFTELESRCKLSAVKIHYIFDILHLLFVYSFKNENNFRININIEELLKAGR